MGESMVKKVILLIVVAIMQGLGILSSRKFNYDNYFIEWNFYEFVI